MSNFHRVTIYWAWKIGRFSFMFWSHGWRRHNLSAPRFFRLHDGGWLLRIFADLSVSWEGRA